MGTGSWWETNTWRPQTQWHEYGHGKWTRRSWADAWEAEHAKHDESDATEPAAKHQRHDAEGESQLPNHADAAAAAINAACAQAAQVAQARVQQAERVALVINSAIDAGIQPITDSGEELHMLDAQQLDAWVDEHMHGGK